MSMTGGISFYDKSKCLFADGASAVTSSNTADQNLLLSTNKYFKWESNGSDDSTTETITITLDDPVSISRIFLVDHNFKAFQITYGSGGTDFANVRGLDNYTDNEIDVTNFSRNTAYFEFNAVTTDQINITIDTTQTVDAEKYIAQVIVTNELGTLEGYPVLSSINPDRNIQKERAFTGRYHIQKGYETMSFDLSLRTYPVQDDIDLLDSLHAREEPFITWICGGLPDQFRLKQRGFRVEDVLQMQIDAPMRNSYERNIYLLGVNQAYSFTEVV